MLEMLAAFAYQYGIAGANMASMRGNHEGSVPEEYLETCEKSNILSYDVVSKRSEEHTSELQSR